MAHRLERYREREWELYRRSVVEKMPDSDYKTAVLAGIMHALMRLDSIEGPQSLFIEDAAGIGTDAVLRLQELRANRGVRVAAAE